MGKRGPIAYHKRKKSPPKNVKGTKAKQAWRRNYNRSKKAMQGYRCGFNLMWRCCPRYLTSIGVKRPGKFLMKHNQHDGVMWCMPHECRMITDFRVNRIMADCGHSGKVTLAELKLIRRMFSFTFQVQGGGRCENYPCMKGAMADLDADALKPTWRPTVPTKLPPAEALRSAFTKPWTPETGVPFLLWCQMLLAAYDTYFNGMRPNEDFSRVKADSTTPQMAATRHLRDLHAGWASTAFLGGRSKLSGLRKGRPWRRYLCCHCPNDEHVSVPEDVEYGVTRDGNLIEPPTWQTDCPLAADEMLLRTQYYLPETRRNHYKTWSVKKGKWNLSNVDDVASLALKFLQTQGVNGDYDRWCGRKVYGRICDELKIKYCESFHVHGDLPSTWSERYQFMMPSTEYVKREQADNPLACIQSGRKIARWLGRGKVLKPELTKTQKLLRALLRRHGDGDLFDAVMDSEDEEDDKSNVKRETVKREPKRKRASLTESYPRKRPRPSSDDEWDG
jgi:hypothetical protein